MNYSLMNRFKFIDAHHIKKYLNSNYFDNYNTLVKNYNYFLYDNYFNMQKLKDEADRLEIDSLYAFFRSHKKSIKSPDKRKELDYKLGMQTDICYNNYSFNINRYNFEQLLKVSKLLKVNLEKACSVTRLDRNVSNFKEHRFFRLIENNGRYSTIVFIKHANSIEYYNLEVGCTYAFKNYSSNITYGQWDDELEKLTKQILYIVDYAGKTESNKLKTSLEAHQFNKLSSEIREHLGDYTKQYYNDILNYTLKEMLSSRISDLDESIDISLDKAIKHLCKFDTKVAEAFKLQEEYDKNKRIEAEIQHKKQEEARKIQLKNIEKAKKLKTEEELKRLEQEKIDRELELELERQKIRKIEEERKAKIDREYAKFWNAYESGYYAKVSGLGYDNLPSKYSNLDNRIVTIAIRTKLVSEFNVDKNSNEDRIKFIHKLEKESHKHLNWDKIRRFIQLNDKTGLEDYIKSVLLNDFVNLVDRKEVESYLRYNQDLKIIYFKYGGTRKLRVNTAKHSAQPLDRNAPKERGLLYTYNDILLDGGDNRTNQTTAELFLCDEAMHHLYYLMGNNNPGISELNTFIEMNILYPKSQRPDCFYVMPEAFQTFTTLRDKKNFTEVKRLGLLHASLRNSPSTKGNVNIYIPCEYNLYLQTIYERCTKQYRLAKDSKKCTLNAVIYEYLMNRLNVDYMH